jgi:hypothetical protein
MSDAQRRFVAIDVEPGGTWRDCGVFGVAEVVGSQVVANFQMAFQHTDLAVTLTFLSAFIDDAPIVVYNRSYDVPALRKLVATTNQSAPSSVTYCALQMLRRHVGHRTVGTLSDCVHKYQLLSADEIAWRRVRFFSLGYGNKWLLNDAQDDALACARLVLHIATARDTSPSDALTLSDAVPLNTP